MFDKRNELLAQLVGDIHNQEFQAHDRGRRYGSPIRGWDERLGAYFWPTPDSGWETVSNEVDCIVDQGRAIVEVVNSSKNFSLEQEGEAVLWANEVFAWGHVPQRNVTWQKVRACIAAALSGNVNSDAPMNSGWTKVAAFTSAIAEKYHLAREDVVQIAIWDSRVAASIIRRLDCLIPDGMTPLQLFPGIGKVPDRSGARPGILRHKWPNGYQSWKAQIAGSKLLESLRDILNSSSENGQQFPQMPLSDDKCDPWTIRGVEMVLFMDGY